MKIAILTTDNREHHRKYNLPVPYFGTAPEALLQGFAQLPEAEVHVVACTQRPFVSSPEKLADNIFYHSLLVPKIGWLRTGYQGCIRAVRKKLKKIQPDIVHGQGTERDCAMAAIFSGFPNVVTIHGNMAELARLFPTRMGSYGWLAARLENFALRRTAGVFCNSAYTEGLVRPRARKTWRVPNALREDFFEMLPDAFVASRKCVLLNVGVIYELKRQLEILDVAKKLRRRNLKFELHFIGRLKPSDPYAAEFLKQIKSLEPEGWARHSGEMPVNELIRHLDSAAGLIHFSSAEAFGLVVAESLARGLKFFGARLGGITDIAADADGAELFGAGDWAGLEKAIAGWIKNGNPIAPAAAGQMREKYHPQIIARRHLEIYREVLSAHL
ncbi:MAG TPA: glycosyltransferase family 4 protein [Verrucomicrobiae bacterium]